MPGERSSSTVPRTALAVAFSLGAAGALAQNPDDPQWLDRELQKQIGPPHMPEETRAKIDKVIVISASNVADQAVDGTYGRDTPGLVGGMQAGNRMGTINREIGGVPIYLPIPGLGLPGAILGGIAGVTMREIQEFRDELTEQMINSDSPPLRSDGLAADAFWGARRQAPHLESHLFSANLEIPEDADAVVFTDFQDLAIDVQGKEAVITTSVSARVWLASANRDAYETIIRYQDRDTLENWTANDNERWMSYQNFARHYLGREIAADVFNRVDTGHVILPAESGNTRFADKARRALKTDAEQPTLAWTFQPLEGKESVAAAARIESAELRWDIEVFDDRQLVYEAQSVSGPGYTLSYPLEGCQTYRWSVRPVIDSGDRIRLGDWMRLPYEAPEPGKSRKKRDQAKEEAEAREARQARIDFGKGLIGRKISEAHAYTQDFPTLTVECRS